MNYNNEYFKYVVTNNNLLVFGDDSLVNFHTIFNYFKKFIYQERTAFNLTNLSSTINEFEINTIIITANENKEDLYEILLAVKSSKLIDLIVCYNPEDLDCSENLINLAESVFTKTIPIDHLQNKIYNILNDRMASADTKLPLEVKSTLKRQQYRDAFDTQIMFIGEELRDIARSINDGDLSEDIFNKLEKNISKVSFIINGYLMSSKTIKILINTLDSYFKDFNLDSIDISAIEGFEHLSNMILDIAVFLDKYFISKEMDNIYVIEDSLSNSFMYVKLVFEGKNDSEEDDSEMEFF